MITSAPERDAKAVPAGSGGLSVDLVAGESAVTSVWSGSPLKILVPQSRGRSVWAFTSSFGGGLLAGDETSLQLTLGAGTTCFLGTQASTKVYRNPDGKRCGHTTTATVGRGSILFYAPDPVQCFSGSAYSQRQTFHLEHGAGLVLVDSLSAGRTARGERWAFDHYASRNEIFLNGRRAVLDVVRLSPMDGGLHTLHRTGRFNCMATVLVLGEPFAPNAKEMLDRSKALPVGRRESLVSSCGPVEGGVLLRMAGEQMESVLHAIRDELSFSSQTLGDNPWKRKW